MADDLPHICFDRLLPSQESRPERTRALRTPGAPAVARAVIPDYRKLWVNGSRLSVRFMGGTPEQQENARQQAAWWTQYANVTFDFNDAAAAEIRIAFDPNAGAWSYIGTDALQIARDQPTMNLGFEDGGTAAHEFGHALGLGHEHQNPAGGIKWNEAEVLRSLQGPPNYWTPEQIRTNVLQRYSTDHLRGTEFDPSSIMLYFFPGAWVVGGNGTNANHVLSETDKAFIGSRQAYPRVAAQEPRRLQVIDTAAAAPKIGLPGDEDLFTFHVDTEGRHVIETSGDTDVALKLFGPDDKTRLVAEDDNGGEGFNARIVENLAPGAYFVQVRHVNTTGSAGTYGVKVTR